jgi:hypothetical protein
MELLHFFLSVNLNRYIVRIRMQMSWLILDMKDETARYF